MNQTQNCYKGSPCSSNLPTGFKQGLPASAYQASLALGQYVKIPSSPQATLLTYETFFDYFSAFLLHHSALQKTAADRARIPLKWFRFPQFLEAEA
jgi:hypothetical protein